jgi:hypothetical protein
MSDNITILPDGSPFIHFQEAIKTGFYLKFNFQIELDFVFLLKSIYVAYPCDTADGQSRGDVKMNFKLSDSSRIYTLEPIATELFSSPSESFRLGLLNELPQGSHKAPVIFNHLCERNTSIVIDISGVDVGYNVQCVIDGRKIRVRL